MSRFNAVPIIIQQMVESIESKSIEKLERLDKISKNCEKLVNRIYSVKSFNSLPV